MENSIPENQLLSLYLSHPLRDSISRISDTIQNASTLQVLKDASTRKYLLTNRFHTEQTGLQPEEFVGLTIEDLNCGYYEGGHDAVVKATNEFDSQVIVSKNIVTHEELLVTYQGFLQILSLIRIPVIGRNNTVIAIFSCELDLTLREDLFKLFGLYKKLYPLKQAIAKFLAYFEVNTYFRVLPSNSETNIIIAMIIYPSHKHIAKLLQISHKTVAHHVWLIGNKLKENMMLDRVVQKIRSKWISIRAN